jgi:hypothetical protein
MTSGDDVLRESLRDLIPDYQPSGDPFARVSASVRRRRARRRTLLAVGSAATVALFAAAVPTLAGLGRPPSGQGTPGPHADGGPLQTRPPPTLTVMSQSRLVEQDILGRAHWKVESKDLSAEARRCLVADDPVVFDDAAWCFDNWQPPPPGRPDWLVTWGVVEEVRPGADVTAVFGVAAAPVATVRVKLDDRTAYESVPTRQTATDPQVRFFAFVVKGSGAQVFSMTPLAGDETPMGRMFYFEPHGGYPYSGGGEPSATEPARAPSSS